MDGTGENQDDVPLIACHGCDLLLQRPVLAVGQRARCPRCGHILAQPKFNSVEKSLALALAGLLLYIPANVLPILSLKLLQQSRDDTLLSGIVALYQDGHWAVAIIVLLSSVVVPLLKLVLMLQVSGCLYFRFPCSRLARSFRWYHQLDTWGMLEVYMLGILVSLVKLADLAEVITGLGLYSFIGLLVLMAMLSVTLDEDLFWELIERRRVGDGG